MSVWKAKKKLKNKVMYVVATRNIHEDLTMINLTKEAQEMGGLKYEDLEMVLNNVPIPGTLLNKGYMLSSLLDKEGLTNYFSKIKKITEEEVKRLDKVISEIEKI